MKVQPIITNRYQFGSYLQPHIRIWNSVSLATIAVIGAGEFTGSVNSLCFSRADSGSMLVAIDDSSDKVISVWEWQRGEKGHKITETRVGHNMTLNHFKHTHTVS